MNASKGTLYNFEAYRDCCTSTGTGGACGALLTNTLPGCLTEGGKRTSASRRSRTFNGA